MNCGDRQSPYRLAAAGRPQTTSAMPGPRSPNIVLALLLVNCCRTWLGRIMQQAAALDGNGEQGDTYFQGQFDGDSRKKIDDRAAHDRTHARGHRRLQAVDVGARPAESWYPSTEVPATGERAVSRAFVKDQDEDQGADDIPDRVVSPHRNLVTPTGLAEIDEELRRSRGGLAAARGSADRADIARHRRDLRYRSERRRRAEPVPG